jgi:hypothetical protein
VSAENIMSEVKVKALEDIETAISELKSTTINHEFNRGYVYGLVNAFLRSNIITSEEHQSFVNTLKTT